MTDIVEFLLHSDMGTREWIPEMRSDLEIYLHSICNLTGLDYEVVLSQVRTISRLKNEPQLFSVVNLFRSYNRGMSAGEIEDYIEALHIEHHESFRAEWENKVQALAPTCQPMMMYLMDNCFVAQYQGEEHYKLAIARLEEFYQSCHS